MILHRARTEIRIALWRVRINTYLWLCHVTRFKRLERRQQIRIVAVLVYVVAMIFIFPGEFAQLLTGFGF